MPPRSARIRYYLDSDTTGLRRGLDDAGRAVDTFADRAERNSQRISAAGRNVTLGFSVAATAGAALAVRATRDFETSLSQIVGLTGSSREQVQAWREDLLRLAPALGKSPQELAEALLQITSAGLDGQQALDALKASARASAAGLGETVVVADAVTSATNAYGASNLSAAKATDVLVATVREGKAEAASIAPVLGRVIPIAAEMGVEFNQVGAAIAAMTRQGAPAEQAVTNLAGILNAFLKPSAGAEEALADVGLSAAQMRKVIRDDGVLTALQLLRDRFEGNSAAIARVLPNMEGLRGSLALVGRGGAESQAIFARMADTTGAADSAFAAVDRTLGHGLNRSMARLRAEVIQAGADLAPLVSAGADLVGSFSELPTWLRRATLGVGLFVAAAGPLMWLAGGAGRMVGSIARVPGQVRRAIARTGPVGIPGSAGGGIADGLTRTRAGAVPVWVMNPGFVGPAGGTGGRRGSPGRRVSGGRAGRREARIGGVRAGNVFGRANFAPSTPATLASTPRRLARVGGVPGAGLVSPGRTGILARVGGVRRVGLAGLAGAGAASVIGGVIGGSGGGRVSGILGGAATGASIGAIAGPWGALAGALAGAVMGGLGQAIADFFAGDPPPNAEERAAAWGRRLGDALGQEVDAALIESQARLQRAHDTLMAARRAGPVADPTLEALGAVRRPRSEEQIQAEREAQQAYILQSQRTGEDAARAFIAAQQQVEYPSVPAFILDAQRFLRELPPEGQDAGAKMVINYARALERNGRVPKGATRDLVASLRGSLDGFAEDAGRTAERAMHNVERQMRGHDAIAQARETARQITAQWDGQLGLADVLEDHGGRSAVVYKRTMSRLRDIIHTGTKRQKVEARAQLTQIRDEYEQLPEAAKRINGPMRVALGEWVRTHAVTQKEITHANKLIAQGYAQTARAAERSVTRITDAFRGIARDFGIRIAVSAGARSTLAGVESIATRHTGGEIGGVRDREVLIQALPGEVVLTRHQQAEVDRRAGPGTLEHVIRSVRRHHSFDTGGMVERIPRPPIPGRGYLPTASRLVRDEARERLATRLQKLVGQMDDTIGAGPGGAQKAAVARWMAAAARRRGLPGELPVMASLVESGLANLRYGDRDSLGYFQQRPSQGWGTPAQILTPAYALDKFLDAAGALRGEYAQLGSSGYGTWIQAVQRSAFPGRYQLRLDDARELIRGSAARMLGDLLHSGGVVQSFDRGGVVAPLLALHDRLDATAPGAQRISSGLRPGARTARGASLHADGRAIDVVGGDLDAYALAARQALGHRAVARGYTENAVGEVLWQSDDDHRDHVHVGLNSVSALRDIAEPSRGRRRGSRTSDQGSSGARRPLSRLASFRAAGLGREAARLVSRVERTGAGSPGLSDLLSGMESRFGRSADIAGGAARERAIRSGASPEEAEMAANDRRREIEGVGIRRRLGKVRRAREIASRRKTGLRRDLAAAARAMRDPANRAAARRVRADIREALATVEGELTALVAQEADLVHALRLLGVEAEQQAESFVESLGGAEAFAPPEPPSVAQTIGATSESIPAQREVRDTGLVAFDQVIAAGGTEQQAAASQAQAEVQARIAIVRRELADAQAAYDRQTERFNAARGARNRRLRQLHRGGPNTDRSAVRRRIRELNAEMRAAWAEIQGLHELVHALRAEAGELGFELEGLRIEAQRESAAAAQALAPQASEADLAYAESQLTDTTTDDVAALRALLDEDEAALTRAREGGDRDVIIGAIGEVVSSRRNLASALEQQAQATNAQADLIARQAEQRADVAEGRAAAAGAVLAALGSSSDLDPRAGSVSVVFNSLHPGDPAIQSEIARWLVEALGRQGHRAAVRTRV